MSSSSILWSQFCIFWRSSVDSGFTSSHLTALLSYLNSCPCLAYAILNVFAVPWTTACLEQVKRFHATGVLFMAHWVRGTVVMNGQTLWKCLIKRSEWSSQTLLRSSLATDIFPSPTLHAWLSCLLWCLKLLITAQPWYPHPRHFLTITPGLQSSPSEWAWCYICLVTLVCLRWLSMFPLY